MVQTSGPSSSSPAPVPLATRDSASDRRSADRNEGGGATLFSDLIAQAGAQLETKPPGTAAGNGRRDKDKPTETQTSEEGSAHAMAGAVAAPLPVPHAERPAGNAPPAEQAGGDARAARDGDSPAAAAGATGAARKSALVDHKTQGKAPSAALSTDGLRAAKTAATSGAAASPATTATSATATTATTAATALTAAIGADGSALGTAAGDPNQPDRSGGRPAGPPQAQATSTAPASAATAQAALLAAMRETSATAPDLAAAAARASAATAAGPGAGTDRDGRLRRSEATATNRGGGAAAARDPIGTLNGSAADRLPSAATGNLLTRDSSGGRAEEDVSRLTGRASTVDSSVFALTMNQLTTAASTQRTESGAGLADALLQTAIDVPVDHADFADAFARQSAGLVIQGSNQAEIRLNPLDMGPIRISISLDANSASLDIDAAHPDTRAVIEASMPALRQMLADQGIRLADYRVDSQQSGERQQQGAGDSGRHDSSRHSHQNGDPQSTAHAGAQVETRSGGDESSRGADITAQALANGFGAGRSSVADGASREMRTTTSQPGTTGNRGGTANSRIDLYA